MQIGSERCAKDHQHALSLSLLLDKQLPHGCITRKISVCVCVYVFGDVHPSASPAHRRKFSHQIGNFQLLAIQRPFATVSKWKQPKPDNGLHTVRRTGLNCASLSRRDTSQQANCLQSVGTESQAIFGSSRAFWATTLADCMREDPQCRCGGTLSLGV